MHVRDALAVIYETFISVEATLAGRPASDLRARKPGASKRCVSVNVYKSAVALGGNTQCLCNRQPIRARSGRAFLFACAQ